MKILFQGDSITDCGRGNGLGQGYPLLVSARLGLDAPDKYEFLNFGISGHRVVDVYARIKKDGWNHNPDVFSILIGINDVWHELGGGNGVEADRFYTVLKMLADDTIARFPDIRMIFMEPFTLNTGVVAENIGQVESAFGADARGGGEVAEDVFGPNIDLFAIKAFFWYGDTPIEVTRDRAVAQAFVEIAFCEGDGIFSPARMRGQKRAQLRFKLGHKQIKLFGFAEYER